MKNEEDPRGAQIIQDTQEQKLPNKVAILYSDVKREYYATEDEYITEEGSNEYAASVAKYVEKLNIQVETFACDDHISSKLQSYRPDVAMNLVDSVRGKSSLGSSVPGMLDILHIPYTGSGVLGWSLGTNKYLMYQLLQTAGVPVPNHQLVVSPTDMIDPTLRYPLFPKLNIEHSSIGIDENSICENEKQLRFKLKDLFSKFRQPVLIDEFIAGIEVTAAVLEGINTKVYTVQRQTNGDTTSDVMTFDKKWKNWANIDYTKMEIPNLRELVKKCFEVLHIADYARIDVRVDAAGRFYFIDPNANPFFGPPQETHATYNIILDMYGISFEETLKRLFVNTLKAAAFSNHS